MNDARRFVLVFLALWTALGAVSLVRFDAPEFRAWEHLYDPDQHRFAPERRIVMQEIGDLGYRTWNRAWQAPRDTAFTTDRFGYRNLEAETHPRIVVIGDSYVAGAGLSDDETVTARLSAALGVPVYNFAGENLNAPALFLREPRFGRQPPDVVIWAPVARGIAPRPLFFRPPDEAEPGLFESVQTAGAAVEASLGRVAERLNRDNGLVRESRFALQGALARWRGDPLLRTLPSGEQVLALDLVDQGLTTPPEARDVAQCIEMVAALSHVLRQAGVRFVFSPVPESGTIYPELFPEAERRARPTPPFLEQLLAGVRARGVEVVDLSRAFEASRWPYLYLPDDSHWNARATQLAAASWAEVLSGEIDLARTDR
ncbi:MAG: hypothetical protein AAF430_07620 [Myxococcota bacterium]